jgi:O-succinylbenzoate synthase
MVWQGEVGWAEWSPFLDYSPLESRSWLKAALEMADIGYPPPVRSRIPVNVTVPALTPEKARALVAKSGCSTAKVKVAEKGQSLTEDIARVEAVRDALGSAGKIRVDANGAWTVDEAVVALTALGRFDLEYAEQPCATVEELAEVRQRLKGRVLIAADESIRRADDPYKVRALDAADIAILKVQPLGGVRACLDIAERIGLPVVVSSALETSIGLRAGIALAAALPELPYACGLNTGPLLTSDLVSDPLAARDGYIDVRDVHPDPALLVGAGADAETTAAWQQRLADTMAQGRRSPQ